MGRRFSRRFDFDLIAKMEGGWKPKDRVEPMKRVKTPRARGSYRSARRNEVLRSDPKSVWRGIKPTGQQHHAPVRPNRLRKWQ